MSEPTLPVLIADAISSQNYKVMWVLLVVIAVSFVGMYFLTRTTKSAELREINNNFKNVLDQQKQLERQTADINAALNKQSIEYQIKLAAYNERSVQAIDDVYLALLKVKKNAETAGYQTVGSPNEQLAESLQEFRNTFYKRKLWIPQQVAREFEGLAIEIEKRANKFIRASIRLQGAYNLRPELFDKSIDDQEDFFDFIYKLEENLNSIIDRVSIMLIGPINS
ncbi:hypothetical protein [Pseudomonas sp. PS02288]|uniref:hypothetical protein n=1 Tax=Pseudomonas sp. PS02288 TaxID=2991443 RepID=UPI00249B713E|nr:hypothetical protein [Pseudomonas sp. PS02288]